jgi:hypothetical protein
MTRCAVGAHSSAPATLVGPPPTGVAGALLRAPTRWQDWLVSLEDRLRRFLAARHPSGVPPASKKPPGFMRAVNAEAATILAGRTAYRFLPLSAARSAVPKLGMTVSLPLQRRPRRIAPNRAKSRRARTPGDSGRDARTPHARSAVGSMRSSCTAPSRLRGV